MEEVLSIVVEESFLLEAVLWIVKVVLWAVLVESGLEEPHCKLLHIRNLLLEYLCSYLDMLNLRTSLPIFRMSPIQIHLVSDILSQIEEYLEHFQFDILAYTYLLV